VKWTIPAVLLLLLVPFCLAADKKEEKPKSAQSIDELRQQIEKILKGTHTNGVSVAIVHKDGPEWVTGLGMADLASNRSATADTLFRIGSTSKAFASLSILLLADQGTPGTCASRSVSGACAIERCSPSSVPFPPQPPRKVALPCSAGSPVLRHSPTSPARTCPPCGLWPSRTGLDRKTKACWRSPGSRACCFSACAGSQTTQDR
jgi:type IV secretory pathway VirB2 component (pilin)